MAYFVLNYADFFFFNDTATTEIYTLSLHDALPICSDHWSCAPCHNDVDVEPDELGRDLCRSEEHTSELQSLTKLVCRLLLEKTIYSGNPVHMTTESHINHDGLLNDRPTGLSRNILF